MRLIIPVAAAFLLVAGGSAWADELRGQVINVDTEAHTFMIGGETIHVPGRVEMSSLEDNNEYDVVYKNDGRRNVLEEVTDISSGKKHAHR